MRHWQAACGALRLRHRALVMPPRQRQVAVTGTLPMLIGGPRARGHGPGSPGARGHFGADG